MFKHNKDLSPAALKYQPILLKGKQIVYAGMHNDYAPTIKTSSTWRRKAGGKVRNIFHELRKA
jgi:hypothetical protein